MYVFDLKRFQEIELMILNRKSTQKDTDYTSHNSTLMLKMVTSYSIFLLIILILFIFLYRSTINNARDSYDQQNETTLVSNAELFESDLNIMEVYCRQLLQNDTFRKVMNHQNTYYPFTDLGNELQSSLATNVYAEALLPLKESFVYFPETDYVLNPTYFISAKRFYNWIQKYPSTEKDQWRSCMTEPEYTNRFLPMDQFMPNYSEKYYIYIIDLDDLYYMDAHAKVCFIFEQDKMADLFDCVQMDGNNFLVVTAEDGSTVLSINTPESISAEMLNSLDFSKGYAEVRIGGQNFTLGKYTSDNTSYSYYFSFPPYKATAGLGSAQLFLILFAMLALLIGVSLIYYFSRRNVRPIIELGQELQTAVEVQKNLQEVVDSQRPIICTSYVRQLLSGTATSEDEVAYMENYLGITGSSYYNVLYIVYYNNFGDNTENALPGGVESVEELEKIIETALENFFGTPLFYFSPSDRTYSVLLHCTEEEEKDLILKINNCILRLHDYLLDTYDIWLFAGIGRNTDSLMNVWECYQQASEAVSYTTKNYIFFPYEFIKKDSNVFYYPPEISTKLIHFISTGNTPQVLELFNLIHQENIEERSLPVNLLKYLLSDIRNTLLKARFALPQDADPEAVKVLDERFNEHLTFKLCEDLALSLCNLFGNKEDDNTLSSTIEKYIKDNYKDPSLGLNKISDEFQISESYFSHMFKEKTGVNFSTYLENIRMTEASRLIKETDISLNELYIAVGYNNSNTFRRAFKKVYGVTPSAMREK